MSALRRRHARGCRWAGAIALVTLLAACGPRVTGEPTLILISLDGFRWDYMRWADTPHLDSLVSAGSGAQALVPAFPTKTFPNHYSIATGLYPGNHGLVANTIFDPILADTFALTDRRTVADGRWYGGEPIWVTAEKQGVKSASMFWPGTEAEIDGVRPTYWQRYDHNMAADSVLAQVLRWLDLPAGRSPRFISMYFHGVDDAGHQNGPDSAGVALAVQRIDSTLGNLFHALALRQLSASTNILITSDHGMTWADSARLVYLDDYIDSTQLAVTDWAPVLALRPHEDSIEAVYNALKGAHPRLHIYLREELPPQYHYSSHYRIPPIVGILDLGWQATTHQRFEERRESYTGGVHGYAPDNSDMHGIFFAAGPDIRSGRQLPAMENIHLYELMCHLLNLEAAPNDGALSATKAILR